MCSSSHPETCGTLTTAQTPPLDTHLAAVFKGDKWSTFCSAEITATLRAATTIIVTKVGFTPDDVSACSMRPGGAMALLMARVDIDTIHLVGK